MPTTRHDSQSGLALVAALDVAGLADYLGASEPWVRQQVGAGRFPHYRVGRNAIRFLPEHVDAIRDLITVPATTTTAAPVTRRRRARPAA